MTTANAAMQTAALLLAATIVSPVAAQPAPAKTAATPKPVVTPKPVAAPKPAAPPAWTVLPDPARGTVDISATAKGGTAQFAGGCSKSSDPGIMGAFSAYLGDGLRTDGQVEHVAFYVRGGEWQDAFSVRLRYSAASQSWEFDKRLSPVFLSSFSRGATLAVVNSRNQEVFSFDLTGSTAATKTMRTICGLN